MPKLINALHMKPAETQTKQIEVMLGLMTTNVEIYNVSVTSINDDFKMSVTVSKVDKPEPLCRWCNHWSTDSTTNSEAERKGDQDLQRRSIHPAQMGVKRRGVRTAHWTTPQWRTELRKATTRYQDHRNEAAGITLGPKCRHVERLFSARKRRNNQEGQAHGKLKPKPGRPSFQANTSCSSNCQWAYPGECTFLMICL